VDLGAAHVIRSCRILWEREAANYRYALKASNDGATWKTVATNEAGDGTERETTHAFSAQARYVRLEIKGSKEAWASFRELELYPVEKAPSYYSVMDRYRLRWEDVVYEPGTLKAVAYRNDVMIGEAVLRTAGPPAALRLTPDRTVLAAGGKDLAYVLVEAVDAAGVVCPRADNLVLFRVAGPAAIAGVGNGNPQSLEPFVADRRRLFHGKAMLILRTREGAGGPIAVTAASEGLADAQADLESL
jgi:hypothetical protein